ncbi:DUF1800 family protein [Flavobacterium sp.]|uniref:DUF1800 domain-containing protein n=1 Tax=Flavobacterium sp. TaxID=239 RepID=UPI00286E971D|nr:DUF1800 family protein [Flavobacterium sp.]
MGNTTLTRRQLFHKLIVKFSKNAQEIDPLFLKYSRKVFNGRKSSSLTYKNRRAINQRTVSEPKPERVNPVTSGLTPYTGTWSTTEALHLLRRIGFGFKKADVDLLTSLSFNDAINTVLAVNNTPSAPPVNYYNNLEPDENGLPYGADWTNNSFPSYDLGNDTNGYRTESLRYWSLGLKLNHDITIKEKMTLFWYHFIPIDFGIVQQSENQYVNTNSARICYKYVKLFRDNVVTSNFKTLIRAMATQPAMMFYLNNQANSKNAPDENFAREIMELFTLGKDVTNVYSQADVVQASKLLTGWRVQNLNTDTESTNFILNRHDTTNKQFSAFFDNTMIPSSGEIEIDLFIDMIFSKSKIVSEYICRRLYRFFVYYDIDANIETNVIVPLAQVFVDSNWDIAPVLDKLFRSEHFFDMANRGVYIKSPFDVILGFMRSFNMNYNVSDSSNHQAQYEMWGLINYAVSEMEQSVGKVPTVSGWQAFYQKPSFHEYWINSNSIQRRFAWIGYFFYGFDVTSNGLTTRLEVNPIDFVKQFPNAICSNPDLLVSECIKYLLPIDLSLDQKNILKFRSLLSTGQPNYYWQEAWTNYIGNTNNVDFEAIVKPRLRNLLVTIVEFAEYQLM